MKPHPVLFTGALGVMAIGLVAGCGGGSSTATQQPRVSFVSPSADSTTAGTFTATVAVDGFTIDADHVGQAAMAGEGHLHFSLDGGKFDQPMYSGANGDLAKKLGTAGKYSPSVAPQITYMGIPAGTHTLKVWLANNDHSDEGASAQVDFTVKSSEMVSFTSPMDGATVASTFTAKVKLADFMINADHVGQAAMAGEGHLHFSLDGGKFDQPKYSGANGDLAKKLGTAGKYSPSVAPQITYMGIPAGPHTLKVWLANNDHSATDATQTISFMVK